MHEVTPEELGGFSKSAVVIGPFGSNLKTSDFTDSGVPLIFVRDIRAGDFSKPRAFVSNEKASELRAHIAIPGDLVVTKMGDPPGDVAIYDGGVPAVITADCIRIRPARGYDTRYLLHAFKTPQVRQQVLDITSGAAQKKVSLERFRHRVAVPVPSLAEQRRIAGVLDHADTLRAKRRQVLTHLDALAQSIFHDMFGASDFVQVPLKDAIKWSSGRFLPAKDQRGGPHPVYGGNGINGSHDEYMFEEPRLVVGRVGAYCGAVHVTRPFSWVTDNALVATLLRDDLTQDYLLPALTIANLNQYAGVSGQPSISGGKIGSVQLRVPPVTLQREFADRVQSIESRRSDVLRASFTDRELFASLQSRAFRGEL